MSVFINPSPACSTSRTASIILARSTRIGGRALRALKFRFMATFPETEQEEPPPQAICFNSNQGWLNLPLGAVSLWAQEAQQGQQDAFPPIKPSISETRDELLTDPTIGSIGDIDGDCSDVFFDMAEAHKLNEFSSSCDDAETHDAKQKSCSAKNQEEPQESDSKAAATGKTPKNLLSKKTITSTTLSSSPGIDKSEWREWDVPLGRQKEVRSFVGNERFRQLVDERRPAYQKMLRKVEKTRLAREIFFSVQSRGGRFLDKRRKEEAPQEMEEQGADAARPRVCRIRFLVATDPSSQRPKGP